MPHPNLSGKRERAEHGRAPRHDKELGHQQSLAIERLADNSRDRTDEQHRQAARDSDDSNQKVECVAS
jgi:hypothetical protein